MSPFWTDAHGRIWRRRPDGEDTLVKEAPVELLCAKCHEPMGPSPILSKDGLTHRSCSGLEPESARAETKKSKRPYYGAKDDPYEAIKVIEAWGLGFNLGNAAKYICRAGKKPGESKLSDLRKAHYYLERELAQEQDERRRGQLGAALAHLWREIEILS